MENSRRRWTSIFLWFDIESWRITQKTSQTGRPVLHYTILAALHFAYIFLFTDVDRMQIGHGSVLRRLTRWIATLEIDAHHNICKRKQAEVKLLPTLACNRTVETVSTPSNCHEHIEFASTTRKFQLISSSGQM